jgi:hypothetical protein
VAHEDRAAAAVVADGGADFAEDALQGVGFVDGGAQRVKGVDAVHFERDGIHARAFEGLHVEGVALAAADTTVGCDIDDHGGDLQQRVGARVEAAGFNVDDDGQEAAEAPGAQAGFSGHQAAFCRRQPSLPPARRGTMVWSA